MDNAISRVVPSPRDPPLAIVAVSAVAISIRPTIAYCNYAANNPRRNSAKFTSGCVKKRAWSTR